MATNTTSALDLLFGQDAAFRWVAEFSVRGRTFTMRGAAGTTVGDGWAELPVWNAAGRATKVKVRETDPVTVLSRHTANGTTVPEATADAA